MRRICLGLIRVVGDVETSALEFEIWRCEQAVHLAADRRDLLGHKGFGGGAPDDHTEANQGCRREGAMSQGSGRVGESGFG